MTDYKENRINFSNPINGRQWLKLLQPDVDLGMTFIPDINITEKKQLGFSFKTNRYGFHGEECADSKNVILGTSFGMGFGVDEGKNWYQLDERLNCSYFNLAIPVAPFNHLNALTKYYKGTYETLLYIYHPNVWKIAAGFYEANKLGQTVFTFMRWKTNFLSLARLLPRWILKSIYFRVNGIELSLRSNGNKYTINTSYNKYNCKNEIFEYSKGDLLNIFGRFNRVLVFRVPIKEQILKNVLNDKKLNLLNISYDECWNAFITDNRFTDMKNVKINDLCQSGEFNLEDYLPNDTHWSPSGNVKFNRIVTQQLFETSQ